MEDFCNNCMGRIRVTKGLVCQVCGRDYGAGPNPEPTKPWRHSSEVLEKYEKKYGKDGVPRWEEE